MMYPAPFRYHRPENLNAALQLLQRLGEDAKPLAGGQTLIPMLKMRVGDVTDLVDIGRLPDLDEIQLGESEARIGALATHARIAASSVAQRLPSVRDCAGGIADAQVRARGTIGGSISTGDPSTDWAPMLHTMAAIVEIQGPGGKREVAIDDFITDAYTTVLQTGELVTGVRIPLPPARSGGAYIGYKRSAPAYPTAAVGIQLTLDENDVCIAARCVLSAVASRPVTSAAADAALVGTRLTEEDLRAAGELIIADTNPPADVRGSADYKRSVLRGLFLQVGAKALQRAKGENIEGEHNYV
ncbi:MAG: xanthine dehydrogenase family protein subunit M [Gammaproteobacteria bacterium]|nr:xanthine dehydrogenase family protein subunit M [Gammaproteobacteria bacterium]